MDGSVQTACTLGSDKLVDPMLSENPTVASEMMRSGLNASTPGSSDVCLAEALQQNAQDGLSAIIRSREPATAAVTRPADVEPVSPPTQHSSEQPQHPASEVRLKRKRAFSNRTKTGCRTCRERKKKCDEQYPECESVFVTYKASSFC